MMHSIIDIGSNSVRLCVFADGNIIFRDKITARLANGLGDDRMLTPTSVQRTADAIVKFVEGSRGRGVADENILLFATAAVRQAKNGREFCEQIHGITGLSVDILSEEREAEASLYGALGNEDGAVLDLGGASTELVIRRGGIIVYSYSLNEGAVKLTDRFGEDIDALSEYLDRRLCEYTRDVRGRLIAVGGTPTSIAYILSGAESFSQEENHGREITANGLKALLDEMRTVSPDERGARFGVNARRGETLLCGGYFLYKIMGYLGLDVITVSEKDNLDGYYLLKARCTNEN